MEYTQLKEQEEKFDQIWQKSLRTLSETGVPESTPITSQFTSDKRMLAFWVPIHRASEVSSELNGLARELHEIDSSFIPQLEGYHIHLKRVGIVKEEEVGKKISEIATKIGYLSPLHYSERIDLRIKGLCIFPTTIFAQVYDLNGKLTKFHQDLVRKLDGDKPQTFEGSDYIPHIALGRLMPSTKPQKLVSSIKEMRKFEKGQRAYYWEGKRAAFNLTFSPSYVDLIKSYDYRPNSKYDLVARFCI